MRLYITVRGEEVDPDSERSKMEFWRKHTFSRKVVLEILD